MNKKILLIGGAGYIGSVLAERLLSKDYEVRCFDSLIYSQKHCIRSLIKKKKYEFILGDLRNFNQYSELFQGITNVVILAGLVGDPITKRYPEESERINNFAVKNFINNCNGKNLEKIIFASTCSNYGLIGKNDTADEHYTLNPLSNYAKQKVDIEKHIMSLKDKVDFSPTILRFATAFGISPRMRFDLTINEFTRELYFKHNIIIYDENTWRPYCHVNDFADLIDKVLKTKKDKISFQIFNAGNEKNNSTKLGIIDNLKKHFPKLSVSFKNKGSDRRNYRVNFSKMKSILNFEPQYSIDYGIQEIISALEIGKFKSLDQYSDNLGNYKIKNEFSI